MSNNKFLEVDSTYRNRNQFSNPADFTMLISQSGSKNRFTALDPVSEAAPSVVFNGSFDNSVSNASLTITSVLVGSSIGNTTGPFGLFVETTAGEIRTERDFYKGAVLVLTNGTDTARRRVLSYNYISTSGGFDTGFFRFSTSFPDSVLVAGTTGTIANATDNNGPNAVVYIPEGESIDNFYNNHIIENVDVGEIRTITGYSGLYHMAAIDTPGTGWLPTHNYIVRKLRASNTGSFVGVPSVNVLQLAGGSSTVDDFYTGSFLRIAGPLNTPPFSTIVAPYNEMRRIVSYDGATQTATVSPGFSVAPAAGVNYEVLPFTRDQSVPFNYTGSLVSQQEMVCYEIELLNLVLPNRTLTSGRGGRIAFYPYVYVELTNANAASAGMKGVIYSNNPNAVRMLFRCAIDDVPNPVVSPYIKIDGDGMVQTVKFKPNDNFKFRVLLPEGDVFETDLQDNVGPNEPNPLVQISAIFSLKRL